LAKYFVVSWAMEEVAPMISIFMFVSYRFFRLKGIHFYFV
jgi:hypothetical protein